MPEIRAYIKLFGEGLAARLVLLGGVSFKGGLCNQPDNALTGNLGRTALELALPHETADMAYGKRILLGCFVSSQEISLHGSHTIPFPYTVFIL